MARILVAEDDKAVQSFVSRVLAHRSHGVTVADDGLAALECLADADFDLLITDIVMPGLDGIGLARKATRDCPDLPILLMTGYSAGAPAGAHSGRADLPSGDQTLHAGDDLPRSRGRHFARPLRALSHRQLTGGRASARPGRPA